MKVGNSIRTLLIVMVLLLPICACRRPAPAGDAASLYAASEPSPAPEPELPQESAEDQESPANAEAAEWIRPGAAPPAEGMNLYWQSLGLQFPADENASLSLYVAAERAADGEFAFDDGQDWMLLFETSSGVYPLFPRQYVQLGSVSCAVFSDLAGDAPVPHVLVTVTQTASLRIYDCIFDAEQNAFEVVKVYDRNNINFLSKSQAQ